MKNKSSGFTLVELIASITILSVIMLIAVPGINAAINKSKVRTFNQDASNLIHSAKSVYNKDTTINEPTENTCVVLPIDALETLKVNGPNKGKYLNRYSFVTINIVNGKKVYGVQLLEEFKNNDKTYYSGIPYTNNIDLNNLGFYNVLGTKNSFLSIMDINSVNNCSSSITPNNTSFVLDPEKKSTLTYDYIQNGGDRVDIESKTYKYNDKVDLSVKAYKDGYEFIGWSARKDKKAPITELYMQDNDMTLYAIYRKKSVAKFIYNAHDADNDHTDKVSYAESSCYIYNNVTECSYEIPSIVKKSVGLKSSKYSGVSDTIGSSISTNTLTNNKNEYYAFYSYKNKLTYKKGNHVTSIDKSSDSCSGFSTYNGSEYSKTLCVISKLPDFKAEDNYKKYGYQETETIVSPIKVGSSYTIEEDKELYALVRDDDAPLDLKLSKEGDSTSSKSHTITVTAQDKGSGLSDLISFKYGFSTSNSVEPSSYNIKDVNTSGSNKVNFDLSENKLTGSYYLWVVPIDYLDKNGNQNSSTIISKDVFVFNNTGSISLLSATPDNFDSESASVVTLNIKVNSLVTDLIYDSDLIGQSKVYIGGKLVSEYNVFGNINNSQLIIDITESNNLVGDLTISIPNGAIKDTSGNVTAAASLSPNVHCNNITYSISYNLNGGLLTNNGNNPTTYKKNDGDIVLVNPYKYPYEFTGWTGSNGSTPELIVTIPKGTMGNLSYTANWKKIPYISFSAKSTSLGVYHTHSNTSGTNPYGNCYSIVTHTGATGVIWNKYKDGPNGAVYCESGCWCQVRVTCNTCGAVLESTGGITENAAYSLVAQAKNRSHSINSLTDYKFNTYTPFITLTLSLSDPNIYDSVATLNASISNGGYSSYYKWNNTNKIVWSTGYNGGGTIYGYGSSINIVSGGTYYATLLGQPTGFSYTGSSIGISVSTRQIN